MAPNPIISQIYLFVTSHFGTLWNCHLLCAMLFMSRNFSHKDKCASDIVRQVMLVELVACASRNLMGVK